MNKEKIIVWFRNDLRLNDHAPLSWATAREANVLPIYIFDPRTWDKTSFGFPKTGAFRTKFLLESLADLKQNLQNIGSDLYVLFGAPENVIPALAGQWRAQAVTFFTQPAHEELTVEARLTATLQPINVETQVFWGGTLYHPEELPFHLRHLPEQFTEFRKRIENRVIVRAPLAPPDRIFTEFNEAAAPLPEFSSFKLEETPFDSRAVLAFKGGETEAVKRLEYYIWEKKLIRQYKQTRNEMLGGDYSSKFSPYLAAGCISPTSIYKEIERFELQVQKSESTYWLIFELLWRDYFRFLAARYERNLFFRGGILGLPIPWKTDETLFRAWADGCTGYPLIDANMRELAATGYISNRGRQNVASFLTKNLGIDWRMGAEWFESLLIDYDVYSNYGNWNYAASIGTDPRGYRVFNPTKQVQEHDPTAAYLKTWLPELANVSVPKIFEPWKISAVEERKYNVSIGKDYPKPIVEFEKSARENESYYKKALLDADLYKIKSKIRLFMPK